MHIPEEEDPNTKCELIWSPEPVVHHLRSLQLIMVYLCTAERDVAGSHQQHDILGELLEMII